MLAVGTVYQHRVEENHGIEMLRLEVNGNGRRSVGAGSGAN